MRVLLSLLAGEASLTLTAQDVAYRPTPMPIAPGKLKRPMAEGFGSPGHPLAKSAIDQLRGLK